MGITSKPTLPMQLYSRIRCKKKLRSRSPQSGEKKCCLAYSFVSACALAPFPAQLDFLPLAQQDFFAVVPSASVVASAEVLAEPLAQQDFPAFALSAQQAFFAPLSAFAVVAASAVFFTAVVSEVVAFSVEVELSCATAVPLTAIRPITKAKMKMFLIIVVLLS